jgi:hypothetical protein
MPVQRGSRGGCYSLCSARMKTIHESRCLVRGQSWIVASRAGQRGWLTVAYAKASLKKYRPIAARNEESNVSRGLL